MNMYLTAILGLCALTNVSIAAAGFQAHLLPRIQQSPGQTDAQESASPQEPAQNTQPANPAQETPQPSPGPGSEKAGSEQARSEQAGPEKAPPARVTPPPTPAQPAQKAAPEASAKKPASTAKTAARKRHRRKRPATSSSATPEKKVVRNGGTADPVVQLSPGVSGEQASRQRQSTTQLLATTDVNLKQLAVGPLSATQQDSVSQIRKYMEQARTAEAAGDVQRAQNLASKALLLSDELVKH